MNPWRLVVEQVESGYAAYRAYWMYNDPKPQKDGIKKLVLNKQRGAIVNANYGDESWFDSMQAAIDCAEKYKHQTLDYVY